MEGNVIKHTYRVVIGLLILICLTSCQVLKVYQHQDYVLPAPLATDMSIVPTTPEPTPAPAFHGLRWLNDSGLVSQELVLEPVIFVHRLFIDEDDTEYIMVYYSDAEQDIINATTGEIDKTILPQLPNYDESHPSDLPLSIMYSSHRTPIETYIALGNKHIYHYNDETGIYTPFYNFIRVIYGFSASSNGDYIAVLLNSEENLGAYADLIILNKNGKIEHEVERFAYVSKSDGFVFPYPIEWLSDDTVQSNQIHTDSQRVTYNMTTKATESFPVESLYVEERNSTNNVYLMQLNNNTTLTWHSDTENKPYINFVQF